VVPPAEMVANLKAGNIDGFLGPDPFNQRAVYEEAGFIHILTKDLWNGHPCCAFGTSTEFIQKNPNTFAALYRAVLTAAAMAREPKNRELIAKVIAPAQYLNQVAPSVSAWLQASSPTSRPRAASCCAARRTYAPNGPGWRRPST